MNPLEIILEKYPVAIVDGAADTRFSVDGGGL